MKKREGDFSVSYADVAETACLTGDPKFVKYAKAARYLRPLLSFKQYVTLGSPLKILSRMIVNAFICITQIGFCCIYLVFTSTNLQEV